MSPIAAPGLATDFSLPDIAGDAFRLSDFKGKYVLVNFWALWCAPCIKEMPSMQAMYATLQGTGFEIVAVHVGPAEPGMVSFLLEKKISFKVLIDAGMSVKGWSVPVLPISYLVGPDGVLLYQALGPREWHVNAMQKLLSPE